MVIFHSYVYVYQRVNHRSKLIHLWVATRNPGCRVRCFRSQANYSRMFEIKTWLAVGDWPPFFTASSMGKNMVKQGSWTGYIIRGSLAHHSNVFSFHPMYQVVPYRMLISMRPNLNCQTWCATRASRTLPLGIFLDIWFCFLTSCCKMWNVWVSAPLPQSWAPTASVLRSSNLPHKSRDWSYQLSSGHIRDSGRQQGERAQTVGTCVFKAAKKHNKNTRIRTKTDSNNNSSSSSSSTSNNNNNNNKKKNKKNKNKRTKSTATSSRHNRKQQQVQSSSQSWPRHQQPTASTAFFPLGLQKFATGC